MYRSPRGERISFMAVPASRRSHEWTGANLFLHRPTLPLWRQPRQVPRERRCQPDITHTRQLHEQPLQPNRKTTMRWHAILERLQISLKWLDRQMRPLQCFYIIIVKVQALPARYQF